MQVVWAETKRLAIGTLILDFIVLAVMFGLKRLSISAIFSLICASIFLILNFITLGWFSVMALQRSPSGARIWMGTGYLLRVLLVGGLIIFSFFSPIFEPFCIILPFLYPKLLFVAGEFIRGKRSSERA